MKIRKLLSLPSAMVPYFNELENRDSETWFCSSDPPGTKVGSGGGTASILYDHWKASEFDGSFEDWLVLDRHLVIHSGGKSRRLPAYSAAGKSLLPLPVFRWSRGQFIDQKLLDQQVAYYEKILSNAPSSMKVLVSSGDAMFISDDRFDDIPEADVVIFGLWTEDRVAANHGVFFSRKEENDRLSFVLQKPSMKEMKKLSDNYYYLMDSGIVLMNARATGLLMKRCGWDPGKQAFGGGQPGFYDLYSDMLTAFGSKARTRDPELNGLDVRVVPLKDGEFYHFGSGNDLIESCLRLQNRVQDQRRIWGSSQDHHPSIFLQNSKVECSLDGTIHSVWIENSVIPKGWKLSSRHILTNIPEGMPKLELPPESCIDIVPVGNERVCLRVYGFQDPFRGELAHNHFTVDWVMKLADDNFLNEITGGEGSIDIHDMKIFPVVTPDEAGEWLQRILRLESNEQDRKKYRETERLSASDLGEQTDLAAVYRQRADLQKHTLRKLADNRGKSIFYQLDLRRVASAFKKNELSLPANATDREPVSRQISDRMFRAMVTGKEKYEREAFTILRENMIATLEDIVVRPERNVLDDQILWGRSPVRFDLAGGWTDTPPYCILNGGKVVNLAVDLNGQPPLQVYIRPLKENRIVLRSIDLGLKEEITGFEQLEDYSALGAAFSIPKAALILAGFTNRFSKRRFESLGPQMEKFGGGLELSLLAAVPKGSGLGTSSNLAATVLGTLSEFCGLGWDKEEICYRTLILEQMLTAGGGWQDQYGGIFDGIKLLESAEGIRQSPTIRWLPDKLFTSAEYRECMLLYYTGVTRVAKNILGEIVKSMFLNSAEHLAILQEMGNHALDTFGTIQANDYAGLAGRVRKSWELNQRLDSGTNPPEIRAIFDRAGDYLLGAKLLGAGGGGYMFMMAKDAEAAARTRILLEKEPPNKRARFVDFSISETGFVVSRS